VAKDFDDAGKNGEKNNYKDDRQKIMFGSSYVSEDTAFENKESKQCQVRKSSISKCSKVSEKAFVKWMDPY